MFMSQTGPHKVSMPRLHFIRSLREVNAQVHLKVHVTEDVRAGTKEQIFPCYSFLWGCDIAALQLHYTSVTPKDQIKTQHWKFIHGNKIV